ncbi:MAG: hypothetical protein K0U89_07035 [Planctomycetes bacterium]|nr:hypothetical protein [Planctomycetota bacterium]
MRIPLYQFEVASDNERELGDLFRNAYLDIPPEIEQKIDVRDLFALRLFTEEFVVGFLPEVKQETLTQGWQTPRFQIKIELGIKYFSICFNGHRKLFQW